jgi:hypothetical protein
MSIKISREVLPNAKNDVGFTKKAVLDGSKSQMWTHQKHIISELKPRKDHADDSSSFNIDPTC